MISWRYDGLSILVALDPAVAVVDVVAVAVAPPDDGLVAPAPPLGGGEYPVLAPVLAGGAVLDLLAGCLLVWSASPLLGELLLLSSPPLSVLKPLFVSPLWSHLNWSSLSEAAALSILSVSSSISLSIFSNGTAGTSSAAVGGGAVASTLAC
jgi:hypothetical protein